MGRVCAHVAQVMHCAVIILRGGMVTPRGCWQGTGSDVTITQTVAHLFSTHPEVSLMAWVAICYSYGGCGAKLN